MFFNSLGKDDIGKIIDIELRRLRARAAENGYEIAITPTAKKFVADAGYDPAYGARPLKRAIMRYIEDPVSEFIIADRALGKKPSSDGGLRRLRVTLTPDRENTTVSLQQ